MNSSNTVSKKSSVILSSVGFICGISMLLMSFYRDWYDVQLQLNSIKIGVVVVALSWVALMAAFLQSEELKTVEASDMTTEQLKLFYKILETKNSWGKNEIKTILLEVTSGIRTSV